MIEEMLEPLVCERFLNDERYRNGHIRIINALPGVRIMGLHIPDMKKLAGELAGREDALEVIAGFEREAGCRCYGEVNVLSGRKGMPEMEEQSPLYYEEKMVWGLMLNALKVSAVERFGLLKAFVPHIDNWAVCDTFCCSAKWVDVPKGDNLPAKDKFSNGTEHRRVGHRRPFWKCTQEELWTFLQPYFRSDKEFEVRFAVIMSMCYLMDKEWLPKIFDIFNALDFTRIHSEYISVKQARAIQTTTESKHCAPYEVPGSDRTVPDELQQGIALGEPPYYVRMGVAWFLATALAKFPDATRAYIAVSRLPQDVIKLYVRKARESFRTRNVSPF